VKRAGKAGGDFLGREFFQRDPLRCARELIGCELFWNGAAGVIVEVEAYAAVGDEAAHTFNRASACEFVAEHEPGAAYVYMNYGIHWLLNVLVKGECDGFVLIRALEPTRGVKEMERRRRASLSSAKALRAEALCSGPGKLAPARGVVGWDHGRDLCTGRGVGFRRLKAPSMEVVTDVRIGISKAAHLPWRFLAHGSGYVSVPHGRAGGQGGVVRKHKGQTR